MNVVSFFYDLNRFDRHYNHYSALADKSTELTVFYCQGERHDSWVNEKLTFIRIFDTGLADLVKTFGSHVKVIMPDVLYCLTSWVSELCCYYGKLVSGVPFVLRLRGDKIDNYRRTRNRIIYHTRKLLLGYMWPRYDAIIPISHRLYDKYKHLGNLSYPVYNGLDSDTFNDVGVNHPFTFGFCGRISKEKGADILEAVFNTDRRFIFAGRNECGLDIPDNVLQIGWVDKETLSSDFYNQIDYLLLPSFNEGVSNVVNEAYLHNVPVIVGSDTVPFDSPVVGYVLPYDKRVWVNFVRRLGAFGGLDIRGIVSDRTWGGYASQVFEVFKTVK